MRKPLVISFLIFLAITPSSCSDSNMKKDNDGNYVVNTTIIGEMIVGYNGTTPLNVYINNDKIVKIEAMKNSETPSFFNAAQNIVYKKLIGKSINDNLDIDGASGATYSSNAIIENTKIAVDYYKAHK